MKRIKNIETEGNPCCNYAHYYIGAKFRMTFNEGMVVEGEMWSVTNYGPVFGSNYVNLETGKEIDIDIDDMRTEGNFQLYLNDDLTKDQRKEYYRLCKRIYRQQDKTLATVDTPLSLDFLLRNHYDVFDLIENGHAIRIGGDKKKKQEPADHGEVATITPEVLPAQDEIEEIEPFDLIAEIEQREKERNAGPYEFTKDRSL